MKTRVESVCCRSTKYIKTGGIINILYNLESILFLVFVEICILRNPLVDKILTKEVLEINLRQEKQLKFNKIKSTHPGLIGAVLSQ